MAGQHIRRYGLILVTAAAAVMAMVLLRRQDSLQTAGRPPIPVQGRRIQTTSSEPVKGASVAIEFQKRPLAVARASERSEWTGEDGRDTNVIRRLAHNDLEYQRMVEENPRIFRRQLVYLKQTAAPTRSSSRIILAEFGENNRIRGWIERIR